jgi:hypothetical protein
MEYNPSASPATFVISSNTGILFEANNRTLGLSPEGTLSLGSGNFRIASGNVVFSDLSEQVTAYDKANSIILVANAPATNKGDVGDLRGYAYLGNTAYYYCTEDYTTGTANIWSKIDSTDAW